MPRPYGSVNKLKYTASLTFIYRNIVRPFLDRYHLHHEQRELKEGIEAFFSVKERPITWFAARVSFNMPGVMWEHPSRPFTIINGTGRRYVKPGSALFVRQEMDRPDYNEVEFDDQVFVLSDAQFNIIKEYLITKA